MATAPLVPAIDELREAPTAGQADETDAPHETGTTIGPQLSSAEAVLLPAKLQWALVGWYRAGGEFGAAAELLDVIAARGGETARLLEERARLALAMGCPGEAVTLQEERVRLAPSATARVGLARIQLEAGNVAAAAAISAELSREHPEMATVGALAADVARAAGDLASARAYHERVLVAQPDHVGALLALGRIALLDGVPREATALAERAITGAGEKATSSQLFSAGAVFELSPRSTQAAMGSHRAS